MRDTLMKLKMAILRIPIANEFEIDINGHFGLRDDTSCV